MRTNACSLVVRLGLGLNCLVDSVTIAVESSTDGYAHVFILLSVVIVTLPNRTDIFGQN